MASLSGTHLACGLAGQMSRSPNRVEWKLGAQPVIFATSVFIETMDEIKHALQLTVLETFSHPALSERNYGDYTGKNKWDVKAAVGDEEFARIRRSWEVRVPGGESLHDVHDRVILYFEQHILTDLQAGKNIIVVSSGNTLRALVKYLDTIPDDKIHELEIGTGEVFVYDIAEDGSVISKQIRAVGGKA
jgi:2,3-bisphosphoglycerate-dependent phosphoglycerate mutase